MRNSTNVRSVRPPSRCVNSSTVDSLPFGPSDTRMPTWIADMRTRPSRTYARAVLGKHAGPSLSARWVSVADAVAVGGTADSLGVPEYLTIVSVLLGMADCEVTGGEADGCGEFGAGRFGGADGVGGASWKSEKSGTISRSTTWITPLVARLGRYWNAICAGCRNDDAGRDGVFSRYPDMLTGWSAQVSHDVVSDRSH